MKALRDSSRTTVKRFLFFLILTLSIHLRAQNRALFYDSLTHYTYPVFTSATTISNYNRPLIITSQPVVHLNLPPHSHRKPYKRSLVGDDFHPGIYPSATATLNLGLGPNNSGIGGFKIITFR